jgi:hypothetical protein
MDGKMETMNFPCGHCGNLMAAGQDLQGQVVRCPHCQQLVIAPVTSPQPEIVPAPDPQAAVPPPAEPSMREDPLATMIQKPGMPLPSEIESIFSPPEESDAVFDGPPRPLVDLPQVELTPDPSPAAPPPQSSPQPPDPTMTYAPRPPESAFVPGIHEPTELDLGPSSAGNASPPAAPEPSTTAVEPEPFARAIPPPVVRSVRDRGGWPTPLIIIPLISYSVLATLAIIYLRFLQPAPPQPPHPLETIPDVGENPGARHQKRPPQVNWNGRQQKDLPARLLTHLKKPVRVGDIEVTPVAVRRRPIVFVQRGSTAEREGSLVLLLHVKNISEDLVFHPMDPWFDRSWKGTTTLDMNKMPFTYLTVCDRRFFGPINRTDQEQDERIRGQRYDRELTPGEEMDTFVCTNPDDPVAEAVESCRQPLLWRVQVRRGLAEAPHRGEVSATAVIGVEFTRDEIEGPRGES